MPQYLGQIVDQGGQVFNVNAYRPTGGTDQQAVDAAITAITGTTNQSGILYFPPGSFTVNIVLPATSAVVHIQGSGIAATRLVSGSATAPVIAVQRGQGNAVKAVVASGFTVVPHASANASTPSLIDLAGFRGSTFRDIAYQQNPAATSTAGWPLAMFTLSAYRDGYSMPCYGNLLSHIFVQAQTYGPRNVIRFENGGTNDVLKNANAIFIEQLWCYSNGNIDYVVDALRSSLATIRSSEIEDNGSATAIRLGTRTVVEGNWFEMNAATIVYDDPTPGVGGVSQEALVAGNSIGQNAPQQLNSTLPPNFAVTIRGRGSVWRENTFYFHETVAPFTLTFAAESYENVWRDNVMHGQGWHPVIADQGQNNNSEQYGVATRVSGADVIVASWGNEASGGRRFDWVLSSSGGDFPGGLWLRDIDGPNTTLRAVIPGGNAALVASPAADKAALWVVPADNTNDSSTPLLAGVTAGIEPLIKWHVTKRGDFHGADVHGSGFYVQGVHVVGARQSAIAAPSGGTTVDTEARTAISSILAALRAHGLIAT